MKVRLTWTDPNTGKVKTPLLETPITIGRNFSQMPDEIYGQPVSRIVVNSDLVADYHFLIDYQNGELIATNKYVLSGVTSNFGTDNGKLSGKKLQDGNRINISVCEIVVNFLESSVSKTVNETSEKEVQEKNQGEVQPCDRMVGFLVKRRCDRLSKVGCEYCDNNSDAWSSYEEDYAYYENFGDYSSGSWGHSYYKERHKYSYDPQTGNVDFTEADAESFTTEQDGEFEVNFDAS